ncbi:MAG: DNA-formamidopyrimidine glycosylase family protein [Candidatus Limnocylindrales bacterium]
MPEGDTIYRTAEVMRRTLGHDELVAARGRPGGARLERVIGSRTSAVRSRGKHLLIDFECGLTLHTHMQMKGSWHRYRPGERWHEDQSTAVAVLETTSAVAVCFGAPTVELLETRALPIHPVLAALGPDLLDEEPDIEEAVRRMRAPALAKASIAEALLDQRVVAGIGNVYRSELLARHRIDPFTPVGMVPEPLARQLLADGSRLLRANVNGRARVTVPDATPGDRWAYRRAGRPCRRCGSVIRSTTLGRPPRRLYWCAECQQAREGADRVR